MADTELVIKIPEELYEAYKGRPPMLGDAGMDMIAQAIANGTPLPDGAEILTKEAYSDLCSRAADVPDTNVGELVSRQAAINALHFWFSDGFDEDRWWNSTHVLAAIEGLPPVQQEHKWETCFECPLSHGCPKIKCCTNEQAIEYASQIPNDCPLYEQSEKRTEKRTETHACDCISREAAQKLICEDGTRLEKDGVYELTMCAVKQWAVDLLDELPSVEPEKCGDCISRKAVLDVMKKRDEELSSICPKDIRELPPVTPQPEVIRCKDCKHWTNNIGDSELRDNYCNEGAHGFYYQCSKDDYCSFAERRTDG